MGLMAGGRLYLTGRIKEMIIIGGKNIFPSDITLLLHEQGVALPMDAVTVFSVAAEEGERPVLCAECAPDADFRALAAQVNRLTAQHFGFSFSNIVFAKSGALPRTDNRKIKTLEAKRLYEEGRLALLYSAAAQGGAARPLEGAPREKAALPATPRPSRCSP